MDQASVMIERFVMKVLVGATGTSQANTGTFDYQAFGRIFHFTLGAFYVNLYAGQFGYPYFNAAGIPMYYTQARWYDPTSGTWLSRDPIGFRGRDWNLYRYVGNNPATFVDRSGLTAESAAESSGLKPDKGKCSSDKCTPYPFCGIFCASCACWDLKCLFVCSQTISWANKCNPCQFFFSTAGSVKVINCEDQCESTCPHDDDDDGYVQICVQMCNVINETPTVAGRIALCGPCASYK